MNKIKLFEHGFSLGKQPANAVCSSFYLLFVRCTIYKSAINSASPFIRVVLFFVRAPRVVLFFVHVSRVVLFF